MLCGLPSACTHHNTVFCSLLTSTTLRSPPQQGCGHRLSQNGCSRTCDKLRGFPEHTHKHFIQDFSSKGRANLGHSCRTLLWDTPPPSHETLRGCKTSVSYETRTRLTQKPRVKSEKRPFPTRLPPKVTRRVSKTSVSYETSSKRHAARLQDERFVRDFLQKSHVESPKRAFRTRLPPNVTLRGCKTSVSYETSSKSHASSLKNERFARDFLQKSHVKVCKTNVSHETSSKSPAETPIGAHTSRSPAKQFRDSSPSKQHPLTRQSQCDSDIHLYHNSQPHDSLRLPRIFPRPHV